MRVLAKLASLKKELIGYGTPIYSANNLTVQWSVYNTQNNGYKSMPILLPDRNGHGGITISYDASMNIAERTAFDKALRAWRCATGVNFTTNATWQNLGIDRVFYIKKGDAGTNPAGSVLARTINEFTLNYCNDNGKNVTYTGKFTLIFGQAFPWSTGTPSTIDFYNIENIGLHELGHAHLIQHNNQSNSLMYYASNQNTLTMRSPTSDAIAAGNHIMNISTLRRTGSNCLTPMLRLNWSNCNDLLNPIEDFHHEPSLSIYPNPAQNFIRIAIGENEIANANLKIYDLLGTLIHKQTLIENNSLIDITKLINGTYVIEIEQKNIFFRSKLIKIKN
jgi:hypothetical protein